MALQQEPFACGLRRAGEGVLAATDTQIEPTAWRAQVSPASWQSTEKQTGLCWAPAMLRARSQQRLPASRHPGNGGLSPAMCPPTPPVPAAEPPQGRQVSSRCAGEGGLPSAAPAPRSPAATSPGDPVRAGTEPRHPHASRAATGTTGPCPGRPRGRVPPWLPPHQLGQCRHLVSPAWLCLSRGCRAVKTGHGLKAASRHGLQHLWSQNGDRL